MGTDDIFSVKAQAEYFKLLGDGLAKGAKRLGMDGDDSDLDPMATMDAIKKALREADAPREYIQMLEDIKKDPDVMQAVSIFENALKGKANIRDIAKLVPQAENNSGGGGFIPFVDDLGLNGLVLQGKTTEEGETDLVRFSNYISGAGTTVGGALVSLPTTVTDLTNGALGIPLFRFMVAEEIMLKGESNFLGISKQNRLSLAIDPEFHRRNLKGYSTNLFEKAISDSRNNLSQKDLRPLPKLRQTTQLLNSEVQRFRIRHRGRLRALKMIGRIGDGLGGVGVGLGTTDLFAATEMLENAENLFRKGNISKSDYEVAVRNAQLRTAQGVFGVGDGLNSIRSLVASKLDSKIKNLSKGGKNLAKKGLRFAHAVGGAFSIGMGITSVTKNAIAAHDALETGNEGRAAMYGIMAGLDSVVVVLDGISMGLDFVPVIGTGLSAIVDLVSTLIDLVSTLIGFFADMVDTRTPDEKLQADFDTYVKSKAFQTFLDNQAEEYAAQGYDLFEFIVDAESLGLEQEGADGTKIGNRFVRSLSEKALADVTNQSLRLALTDATSIGKELKGRLGDDLIKAGAGNDILYGKAGDDILLGRAGKDTIYGGPGNDYISGGASVDELFGGIGNDALQYEPGIDKKADGGAGNDTLIVSTEFFSGEDIPATPRKQNALKFEDHRVFVDFIKRRGGIALGALLDDVDMLSNPMHKPAFYEDSDASLLRSALWSDRGSTYVSKETVNRSHLWYLARISDRDYVTDGDKLYSCKATTRNQDRKMIKYSCTISDLTNASDAQQLSAQRRDGTGNFEYLSYKRDTLRAKLAFAFVVQSDIPGIEKVSDQPLARYGPLHSIKCSVIGDDNVKFMNIAGGDNEYVYTGNEDTTIVMNLSYTAEWELWKYIIGGSGSNTLLIRGREQHEEDQREDWDLNSQVVLLDHDIDLSEVDASRESPKNGMFIRKDLRNRVDRGIFLKNIRTIHFSNTSSDAKKSTFRINATYLSGGHTFVIDEHYGGMSFRGASGDDNIMIRHCKESLNNIDGNTGRNMLILDESCKPATSIDISERGLISGNSWSANLTNILNVQGHSYTTSISGHPREGNMLIANGGHCTVNGRGGNNCFHPMRGQHTLQGGSGLDTYDIYGPLITDFIVITVVKEDEKIEAKSNVRREWDGSNGEWDGSKLTIELLKNDPEGVELTEIKFVDSDGTDIPGKGKISISPDKRKIIYDPDKWWYHDSLESFRVQYVTRGNEAIIRESTVGNILVLHGYSYPSQVKLKIADDGNLQCLDNYSDVLIFTDTHFGDLVRSGITNLDTLFLNFAERFPVIQFKKNNSRYSQMRNKKEVYNFLHLKLGYLNETPSRFDNTVRFYDTNTKSIVDVIGGDNFVTMSWPGVTYRSGNGDDFFNFTYTGTANRDTILETGAGDDIVALYRGLQVRFIEHGAREKQGVKTVIFRGKSIQSLSLVRKHPSQWNFESGDHLLTVDALPDYLICQASSGYTLVDGLVTKMDTFFRSNLQDRSKLPRREYNLRFEQKLYIQGYREEHLHVAVSILNDGYLFTLSSWPGYELRGTKLYVSWLAALTPASLDTTEFYGSPAGRFFAESVAAQFKRGIAFADKTVEVRDIPGLVTRCLSSNRTSLISRSNSSSAVGIKRMRYFAERYG